MSWSTVKVDNVELEKLVTRIFEAAGLDILDSKKIARHLVLANMRGVDSHGVSRVAIYLERMEKGLINKCTNIQIEKETSTSALIDGCNSPGIPVAKIAIDLAVKKALKNGLAVMGVKNSNHCGMLADYTNYAAEHDCIAVAATNAGPNMAPWGGRSKFFGTNPFSYGIPSGEEINIVFDTATSVVSRGKIILAKKNNQEIPLGWAISKEGSPTQDPTEAIKGLVLPVGGPKGYGLAFAVDVLSGLFSGASYGPYIPEFYDLGNVQPQKIGHFFFVMRADLFQDLHTFKNLMDKYIKSIREIPLAKGVDRIYLPGEIEFEKMKERRVNGIPITTEVIDELHDVANKYGISFSFSNLQV